MKYYVTLFDSKYMLRGMTLYESLIKHSKEEFLLVVIAFDDVCYRKLVELNLPAAEIVLIDDFEDDELRTVKPTRTRAEYCWTCTAKSILYVFDKYECEECTYIDSDICFFADPQILLDETDEYSVMITEHRYTPEYDQTEISGKYCVQFMYFKNDKKGLETLTWWKDRCIEWCGAIPQDGKLGEQKYLDDWIDRFSSVHEMQNLGGGIAPWNVQQYTFFEKDGVIRYKHISSQNVNGVVVFYHFHQINFFDKDVVKLTSAYYRIPDTAVALIYKTYIRLMMGVRRKYCLEIIDDQNRKEEIYRSDIDRLQHERNLYNISLFV